MSTLGDLERNSASQLIRMALEEDLAQVGDLTSQTMIPESLQGQAAFVVRSPGVLAGLPIVQLVIEKVSPHLQLDSLQPDGTRFEVKTTVAILRGPLQQLLTAERTALNFLQRLSGIATLTRRFVDAVSGIPVKILDTRKTTPGWRYLEKYAVRMGGGTNHRMGLFDGLLIKDNHLAGIRIGESGSKDKTLWQKVAERIEHFRTQYPKISVEIEVDTLEQLEFAFGCNPDIVLLDNMNLDQLRSAVHRRNTLGLKTLLEASGGVNLTTVKPIAETGVDRISIGALTHSATALDIGLDYVT